MSDEVKCVCGRPECEHTDYNDTGGRLACNASDCYHLRPVLPWPDSEGWWWQHDETDFMAEIVFVTLNGGQFVIWQDDEFLTDEQDWYKMTQPRFTRLLEPNPFTSDHGCTSDELAKLEPIDPGFYDAIAKIPPDEPKFDDDPFAAPEPKG